MHNYAWEVWRESQTGVTLMRKRYKDHTGINSPPNGNGSLGMVLRWWSQTWVMLRGSLSKRSLVTPIESPGDWKWGIERSAGEGMAHIRELEEASSTTGEEVLVGGRTSVCTYALMRTLDQDRWPWLLKIFSSSLPLLTLLPADKAVGGREGHACVHAESLSRI